MRTRLRSLTDLGPWMTALGRLARRVWRIGRWVLAILVLATLWGAGLEPRLVDSQHIVAPVPNLPPEWDGRTVALIADLQVGMWLANLDTIRRIIRELVETRPAAVLIASDFVYEPTEEAGEPAEAREELEAEDLRAADQQIALAVSLIRPLVEAGIPTYAVPGNHDYAMQWPDSLPLPSVTDRLETALAAAGIPLLRNDALPMKTTAAESRPLYLVGLDAEYPKRANAAEALAQLPPGASRVVLMHNPASFLDLPPGSAPLALAAHTHGGQIRIPFVPNWSWIRIVQDQPTPADGWADRQFGARGNRLYINRGIGFSVIPVRLNCPPELTFVTLIRG
ncbi:MAG: metallophosphoesterase [Vicinamibacterales bacterium]